MTQSQIYSGSTSDSLQQQGRVCGADVMQRLACLLDYFIAQEEYRILPGLCFKDFRFPFL